MAEVTKEESIVDIIQYYEVNFPQKQPPCVRKRKFIVTTRAGKVLSIAWHNNELSSRDLLLLIPLLKEFEMFEQ